MQVSIADFKKRMAALNKKLKEVVDNQEDADDCQGDVKLHCKEAEIDLHALIACTYKESSDPMKLATLFNDVTNNPLLCAQTCS